MVYFLVNEDLNIPFAIIFLFGTKITPDGIHNTEKQKFPCLFKVYSDKAAEQAVMQHIIPDRKHNPGWFFLALLHGLSHRSAGYINKRPIQHMTSTLSHHFRLVLHTLSGIDPNGETGLDLCSLFPGRQGIPAIFSH
jgi:hypothetical protein